nr:reverse transcriptase domain-containing protein [Tanacetum cinerariifolium]
MDPEEEDGDDEKSEGDSIDYPTSRGDDDADDDGNDLSEDDVEDEDEEESSNSEEEEEEHLASTVPAPALHSSISASEDFDQTEPFKEEVERLLSIPTPPLSPVSLTSYPLPPFLMPLPIFTPLPPPPIILPHTRASMVLMRSAAPSTFILAPLLRTPPIETPSLLPIPLPTSSFPLPLLLPSTSYREGILEADMPLQKKARFTTPTGGYEVGESSVAAAAAARQIRPTLTVDNSRRAEDRLIGRLRRERRYFCTLSTTYAILVTRIEALQRDVSTLQGQQINDKDRLTRHIQHEHAQRDAAPEDGPRTVRPTRECTYKDYLNCSPLKFNGTQGVIGLTRCFERTESVSSISNCTTENQEDSEMMTARYCPRGEVKKWEVKLWNLKVKGTDITSYTLYLYELALLCGRRFLEESDKIERYIGRLPKMIRGNVMSYEPKSMQKAIEFANDQMDQKLLGIADRQADKKWKFDNTSRNQQNQQPFKRNNNVARAYAAAAQVHFKNNCPKLGNRNQGNKNQGNQNQAGNGNDVARAYGVCTARGNPNANVVTESGVMLVLPADPGLWSEVISRWESITINRLNNQTWFDNKAKLTFVENLLGESEKLMWQQWRTVFPKAYTDLEAIADEPQNITSQVRQLILLEDPYRGSTDKQDRAYRDLDRITCEETKNLWSFLEDFRQLATKSGRLYFPSLGESEKLMWQQWRTVFPKAYT